MTLAQAQACGAAISGAGFDVSMKHDLTTNDWTVRALSSNLDIPIASAHSLATSQGVTATVALVEYK